MGPLKNLASLSKFESDGLEVVVSQREIALAVVLIF